MRKEGLIRHVGLSQVSIEQIESAQHYFPVATVQNRFNLADRESEDVLDYCERHGIGFIPWYPLAAGELAGPDRSEEHTSELQSLMRNSYAVFCLKKKKSNQ